MDFATKEMKYYGNFLIKLDIKSTDLIHAVCKIPYVTYGMLHTCGIVYVTYYM